jgi:regulator of replication initiation timing
MNTEIAALNAVCDQLASENVKLRLQVERMLEFTKAAARLNAELLDQVDEVQQLREENAHLREGSERWRDLALFLKSDRDAPIEVAA